MILNDQNGIQKTQAADLSS